jgi:heptosyltransferase-2
MLRVAVIQTAFPGDVILCTPVFKALKSAGHKVTAVIRPQAEPLLRHDPFIDQLILYDKKGGMAEFLKAVDNLKKSDCDIALIVQRYFKSALLAVFAGIAVRIGYDIAQAKFLYTDEIHYDKDRHEVERCLALCRNLSSVKGFKPRIFFAESDTEEAKNILVSHGIDIENFITIAPGSIWNTKRWVGYDSLLESIKKNLPADIVLLGSPDDAPLCDKINHAQLAVNLAGKTDLLQSSAIFQLARLAITNDSAPAHIAAAVGTPVVAIFGPTVPEFGFAPYTDKKEIVEIKNLYCRPCSSHGPMVCPEKHFRCMREVTVDMVWEACERLLKHAHAV